MPDRPAPQPQSWAPPPQQQPRPLAGFPSGPGSAAFPAGSGKQRRHSRAFVALMVATGVLGVLLTGIVFSHIDSSTGYQDDYTTSEVYAPAEPEYEAATPAALAELVSRLLPERTVSHLRGSDPLKLLFYLDLSEGGNGMVTLTVKGKRNNPVRDGEPKVVVSSNTKNCVQNKTVTATWPDGTVVQADVATCLAWDGSRNPPAPAALTTDEAKALVSDPQWGMMMDAELVSTGADNHPDLV